MRKGMQSIGSATALVRDMGICAETVRKKEPPTIIFGKDVAALKQLKVSDERFVSR